MKVYFADSGLLVALLDEEAQEDLRANKNLGVYKGALYENVVGEALVKSGYELYYYKREDSTLEEDFFVRTASELIPVEVKAKSGKAKSMQALIENDRYPEIHHGIKLTGGNVGFSEHLYLSVFLHVPDETVFEKRSIQRFRGTMKLRNMPKSGKSNDRARLVEAALFA